VHHCLEAASTCRDHRRETAINAIERCAEALVELQGTVLTVNCSCSSVSFADGATEGGGGGNSDPETEMQRCESARNGLPLNPTPCTGMNWNWNTVFSPFFLHFLTGRQSADNDQYRELWAFSSRPTLWNSQVIAGISLVELQCIYRLDKK